MEKKNPLTKLNSRPSSLPGASPAYRKDHSLYYRASFTCHRKHISLGSYATMEEAHGAYEEANLLMQNSDLSVAGYKIRKYLSFEKWIILCNLRDNGIYFSTPIYMRNNYFSYFLDEKTELKFSIDDLFYYSSHKIMKRKGHLFVSDYGMQVTILSRYGIKSYGIRGQDYLLLNNDPYDFRYENIEILNSYHGVQRTLYHHKMKYQSRIHIRGNYIIGYFSSALEAAIAYNKAVDFVKDRGCKKQFLPNYIDGIKPSQYAEIYHNIRIPEKIMNLKFEEKEFQ